MVRASVFIESLILFFVILCGTFIFLPFIIKTNQQEKNIVKWEKAYSNISYAFKTLKIQNEEKEEGFITLDFENNLKQIFRGKKVIDSSYKIKFINTMANKKNYEIYDFFESKNGEIIGFKWINKLCKNENDLCAAMSIDINGYKKPNKWGRDVFGINIYRDNIKPAGYNLNYNQLKKDCSKKGSGVYCSAYYLIGGSIVK